MGDALRLDRPAGQKVAQLPADFGRRFLVFVDTEEEFDWGGPFRRTASTTTAEAIPAQHARFAAAGIKPTYLATWPIINDARAAAMLREFSAAGEAAIGAQLHPWVTPPFEEELNGRNSFCGNLPEALEEAKLVELTAAITDAIGAPPIVYRAGRYGVSRATARLLHKHGYRLDTSIRPAFDYSPLGGPDFTGFGPEPLDLGGLFALPLGVCVTGALRRYARAFLRLSARSSPLSGIASRLGLVTRVPLTSEGVTAREALAAIDAMIEDGVQLFSLSFHSPSLVPGHTPYVRTAADLLALRNWWDTVVDHLLRRGVAPCGADELIGAFAAAA